MSSYNVIVIGAGNAALCAALSAQENGARVLVLERSPPAARGGNSAHSGGAFRVVFNNLKELRDDTAKVLRSAKAYRMGFLIFVARPSSRLPVRYSLEFPSIVTFDELIF